MTSPVATPAAPLSSASLYVGDLDKSVNEAQLFEIFNAVGLVGSVRICREMSTRRSLGYGYVNYQKPEDAERALDTLNHKPIMNRPCRIMWSHRDPSLRRSNVGNVFVKNLPKGMDSKTLADRFSVFGNILSCKVATGAKEESLGYGFVHFENPEAAQAALKGASTIEGKVVIAPFVPKKERSGGKADFTNVFVKNLPETFTQEDLTKLFSKHGEITSSSFGPSLKDRERPSTTLFAFVDYAKPEYAKAAIEALNNFQVGDKKIFVGRHQKKYDRERELKQRFETRKQDRLNKYQGMNIYVKNLADTVTDEILRAEFSKYGNITSAKVMITEESGQAGKSKGFGFVCFSSAEEAARAVTDYTSTKMLEGKPLYVALAQRKEARRAQLEMTYGRVPAVYPPAMFFPAPPRGGMFPQPMMGAGQWRMTPNAPMMMPGQNFQLMPASMQQRAGPGRGGAAPRGRGGVARGGQAGGPRPQMAVGQQQQQQGGRYRGQPPAGGYPHPHGVQQHALPPQQVQQQQAPRKPTQTPQAPASKAPGNILDILAGLPDDKSKKQQLGNMLFPLVSKQQPELASKLTGMMLEMDNGEIINLIESQDALNDKITEGIKVLEQGGEDDEDDEEEEEEEEEN